MFDRLQAVEDRYERLHELLSDPDIVSDSNKLREYSKEQSDIQEMVEVYREYKSVKEQFADTRELMEAEKDSEMLEMMKEEFNDLNKQIPVFEERLRILLIPKDPNDSKNVIMEVRGAAGGDEANIFAGDLYRMYSRYAETQGWKIEIMEATPNPSGGYKEIIFMINGQGAYSKFKYESGAHRVQRIPATESQGRIHTSTATVACLTEMHVEDVEIHEKDIRVDTFASSGAGGQSVNTTMSAVRMVHLPTGVVVSMQDERSQIKNREKAMKILVARVAEKNRAEAQAEIDSTRKSAVGTGDRSERIRTYNYPQNRVTDHRIGLTIQKLDQIVEGKMDEIIDALILDEQATRLAGLND